MPPMMIRTPGTTLTRVAAMPVPESQQSRPGASAPSHNVRTAAIWEAVHALAAARQRELGRPLVVLDLGGGTGGLAVPLALAGHHVHVLDPRLAMRSIAVTRAVHSVI